jgi:hypothetical protein
MGLGLPMTPKTEPTLQVVDKRRIAADTLSVPSKYRPCAVLLGYLSAEHARDFLDRKGAASDVLEQAMQVREQAVARIKTLPPFDHKKPARQRLQNAEAQAEIQRVMSRPECKSAFPEGSWTAELVEIASIIPVQPSLDVAYAQSLGEPDLGPSNLLSAVKLCFAEKHPTEFEVSVDQRQKAISISGINPSLEVVGLRYESQPDGGTVIASFMVSPAPNIVVVSRYAGRHFLWSGYHRVYRLMKVGYSHVPCTVREIKSLAQAGAYGPDVFREEALMAPRPPLFPDFADPVLASVVRFPAVHKVVRIRPDEYFVSA